MSGKTAQELLRVVVEQARLGEDQTILVARSSVIDALLVELENANVPVDEIVVHLALGQTITLRAAPTVRSRERSGNVPV